MDIANNMMYNLRTVLKDRPQASAVIRGSREHSSIRGRADFYQTGYGVLVSVLVRGLPTKAGACGKQVFAVHIHSGNSCTGDPDDPFAAAMTHYNPDNCPHPYHAGDMPPLFDTGSGAFMSFLTDRFTIDEIIGRVIIIHSEPDDFTTQPSGNSGKKIACGVIRKN